MVTDEPITLNADELIIRLERGLSQVRQKMQMDDKMFWCAVHAVADKKITEMGLVVTKVQIAETTEDFDA